MLVQCDRFSYVGMGGIQLSTPPICSGTIHFLYTWIGGLGGFMYDEEKRSCAWVCCNYDCLSTFLAFFFRIILMLVQLKFLFCNQHFRGNFISLYPFIFGIPRWHTICMRIRFVLTPLTIKKNSLLCSPLLVLMTENLVT